MVVGRGGGSVRGFVAAGAGGGGRFTVGTFVGSVAVAVGTGLGAIETAGAFASSCAHAAQKTRRLVAIFCFMSFHHGVGMGHEIARRLEHDFVGARAAQNHHHPAGVRL